MSGAILATAIRVEMAYPGSPFFGGDSLKYLQVITAHALIMIFFVVVPIFFGGFANYLLPYHVGSKDVAFPRLNSLGFWIQPCGYLLVAKIGFLRTLCWTNYEKTSHYFNMRKNTQFIDSIGLSERGEPIAQFGGYDQSGYRGLESSDGNKLWAEQGQPSQLAAASNSWKLVLWRYVYMFPEAFWFLVTNAKRFKPKKRHVVKCTSATQTVSGWTFITPFSSKTKFTGVGVQDMLILGVYFVGISSTISLVNLLATRRTLSIPGLRNRRILLPFISITILLMLRALAVITPVLGSAMLMLAFDRHWKTSFFDFAYGGDPVFFHHLFWFFGHPEVYVLVIPAFGVINSVLPSISLRRVASKHHLVWAIYIMNYMGFLVWGHHMYLIGLDHRSRALYTTITIMISMPATIKVVNWTFTLVNGAIRSDLIFFATISFIMFFLVAGFTGMWLSHVSLNISMHDTLYVVAHFHLMLSGAVVMSIFVGIYAYFNNFFQVKFSRTFGFVHISLYTGGQWATFIPLFWVSFSGLPRRLHDFPAIYMGWQSMATAGHFVTMLGVLAFYFTLIDSKLEKKIVALITALAPRLSKRPIYYITKYIYMTLEQKKSRGYYLAMATALWYYLTTFAQVVQVSLITFVKFLVIFLVFTMLIATVTLIERKVLALTQRRVGPNYIGYKGRLQFIADALKLLAKHIVLVTKVNRLVLVLVPSLFLLLIYLFWANVVWMPNYSIIEIEYNILLANIISILFSGLLITLGYASNNKFAILSAHRVFVSVCTLEILMGFFGISCALIAKTLSFYAITTVGQRILNFVILMPVMPILLLSLLLETGRTPFDLAEAESELIAGYATEYGGFFFAMFYLGEYFHLFSFSAVYALCLFGGWTSMLTWIYKSTSYINPQLLGLSYTNFRDVVIIGLLAVVAYLCFFSSNSREKIVYFCFFIVVCALFGFSAHLDAYVFFLLTTEFMAVLMIFVVFLNPRVPEKNKKPTRLWFWPFVVTFYLVYFLFATTAVCGGFAGYHQVYLYALDNSAHDLAPVFWFFSLTSPWVGFIISVLLGLFSFFFIGYYYAIKNKNKGQTAEVSYKKRQNFFKQRRFNSQLGCFRRKHNQFVPKRKLYNTHWLKWNFIS